MVNNARILYLLNQVSGERASSLECTELLDLLNSERSDEVLAYLNEYYHLSSHKKHIEATELDYWKTAAKEVLEADRIANDSISIYRQPVHRIHFLRNWGWAAAILVLLITGAYLFITTQKNAEVAQKQATPHQNDILPGSNKAMLTLADGNTIQLDSLANTVLAKKGIINKNALLSYASAQVSVINTLTTPRGGQYKLKLSDGTMVWLNAASSITYPTVFTGNERKVEIKGEAYFEVADNERMPFKVQLAGKAEIQVLGTHFNVNAYDNEDNLKVTLLEGAVKVTNHISSATIQPGQQAILTKDARLITQNAIDLDEVMGWKNGLFKFKEATIEAIMRQIESWYDVEVVYEGKVTQHFITTIPRNLPVSQVCKYLETTGKVHFKIDGKRITVMP